MTMGGMDKSLPPIFSFRGLLPHSGRLHRHSERSISLRFVRSHKFIEARTSHLHSVQPFLYCPHSAPCLRFTELRVGVGITIAHNPLTDPDNITTTVTNSMADNPIRSRAAARGEIPLSRPFF